MDEIETTVDAPAPRPSSPWKVAATCGALMLLVVAGGVLAVRDKLLVEIEAQDAAQSQEREKLAAKLGAMQGSIEAIANQARPNNESLSGLDTKISEMNAKLDTLNARVETLETQPQSVAIPAPVAFAPRPPEPVATTATVMPDSFAALKLAMLSGKPFAAELAIWAKQHPEAAKQTVMLGGVAESGIASEADLNRKLRAALDDAAADRKVDDTSMAGKINTHLAGLVSIKKSGQVDTYSQLRRNVLREDVATLTRGVEALSDEARKPLEPWLSEAKARREALDALAAIEPGSAH
ncbi:MAG: hypothetical protein ACOYNL_01355 [Rickettsiales bacterium]